MGLTTRSELLRSVKRILAEAATERPKRGSAEYAILEEFANLYHPILIDFCRKGLGLRDADAISDVVQDVWTSVLQKLPDFDYDRKKGGFRRWLYVILKRRAIDYADGQSRRKRIAGQARSSALFNNILNPNAVSPQDRMEQEFKRQVVRAALRQFEEEAPRREYVALIRCQGEEVAHATVAKELGISADNVTNALARARGRLRRILRSLGGDPKEFDL